jgi:hypothetical protein
MLCFLNPSPTDGRFRPSQPAARDVVLTIERCSTMMRAAINRAGKVSYGLVAILLGLPLPVVILAFLWGGCR